MADEKKIAKVSVDRNLCIGAGPCVFAAGTVFELDAEQKAVILQKGDKKDSGPVVRGELADDMVTDDALMAAAQACPVRAVLLHDEEGNQLYP